MSFAVLLPNYYDYGIKMSRYVLTLNSVLRHENMWWVNIELHEFLTAALKDEK
jgi:hypothetical protein